MDKIVKYTLLSILMMFIALPAFAQQQEERDSLVRLLTADKARLVEQNGKNFRKVIGNVVFFHNDTYLYCDSAYWNVDEKYIDAIGSIIIEQEGTTLTGDSIKYVVDENTAKFRGHLVELRDKEGNTLRTSHLDYNTKDSVASFYGGAAMKDKDGNLIESLRGRYDSKADKFYFYENVETFSDSMFFVCDYLLYNSATELAEYEGNVSGWYDLNSISARKGWYDRRNEQLSFYGDVYGLSEDYELWSDTLYYDRYKEYTNLLGSVQLLDTVDNALVLCGELRFWNEPRRAELYRDPVMVLLDKGDDGTVDSTFMAADTLYYYTQKMCDVDSALVELAKERYQLAITDPLEQKKASGSSSSSGSVGTPGAGKKQNKKGSVGGSQSISGMSSAMRPHGTLPMPFFEDLASPVQDTLSVADSLHTVTDSIGVADSLTAATDSLGVPGTLAMSRDTLAASVLVAPDSLMMSETSAPDSLAVADSVAALPPPDTTEVTFVEAFHHVRIYRDGIQATCDSLLFTSIDSLARLFKSPIIWYDIKNQVTADSMQFLIRNQELDRGLLFSNSFVISEEMPGKYYHQIKSPEMIGYFSGTSISRFDALGGANLVFFLAEDSVISTVNKKETRIMSATLKDGELQRILYLESTKSDAFPVFDLKPEDYTLKGYNWQPDLRPKDRFAVTDRKILPSGRKISIPDPDFPEFKYSELYFEGYMEAILKEIDSRKPLIWLDDRK